MNGIDPKIMKDYVATANNPQYNKDWNIINSKFPELKDYDPQLLKDYVATANNPKYGNNYNEINSKFPELFSDTPQQVEQKKNTTSPQTPSVATQTGSENHRPRHKSIGCLFKTH